MGTANEGAHFLSRIGAAVTQSKPEIKAGSNRTLFFHTPAIITWISLDGDPKEEITAAIETSITLRSSSRISQ